MTGAAAAELLGEEIADIRPLQGGDLSEVMRVTFTSGRTAVAKTGRTARAEAEMLRALGAAGAPAPEVLAATDDLLVLSDLGPDQGLAGAWRDLGTSVRRLHSTTGRHYGWSADHAFGTVAIRNAPLQPWPDFWAVRRLMAELDQLPPGLARRIERLCGRLDSLLPEAPPPALLHGDLWSGNVMAAEGRVTGLIDPACYFGHAEVDLAMLALFGAPGRDFWTGYGPPEPGHAERQPVYQLWPAIVHLRLFGGAYASLVERLLSEVE